LTLWDKTQWVHNTADEIAAVFGIPAKNIRVISPFVGVPSDRACARGHM
jgi:xanthine dehydrogenase YagR molybdenum-binding subunit